MQTFGHLSLSWAQNPSDQKGPFWGAGGDKFRRFRYEWRMDSEVSQLLTELRKLERQAKGLLYKMERIQTQWSGLKDELKQKGKEIPHELGDELEGYGLKTRR